jgi:hypothetical protein
MRLRGYASMLHSRDSDQRFRGQAAEVNVIATIPASRQDISEHRKQLATSINKHVGRPDHYMPIQTLLDMQFMGPRYVPYLGLVSGTDLRRVCKPARNRPSAYLPIQHQVKIWVHLNGDISASRDVRHDMRSLESSLARYIRKVRC